VQFVVLHLVRVRVVPFKLPERLAVEIGDVTDLHKALGALELLVDAIVATGELSALAGNADSAWVLKVDSVVVIDLTGLAIDAVLTSTDTVASHRHRIEEPVGHVDVVHMLLADVVTAEPVEVVPVVDLELHLVLVFASLAVPDAATVPVDLATNDVAGETFADASNRLAVAGLVVTLQADHNLAVLLVGHLGNLEHEPCAEAVNADGLLHEDVLASLDRSLKVIRTEARRRGQNHKIDVGQIDQLLIGVEANELAVSRHINLALVLHLVDGTQGTIGIRLERIGNRRHLHIAARDRQCLLEGACASATTTDQTHTDRFIGWVLGMHGRHAGKHASRGTRGDHRVATRNDRLWG